MEVTKEVKVVEVNMKCDECNEGLMEATGDSVCLTTLPPQTSYRHKCSKCGRTDMYSIKYPYYKYVAV